MITLKQYKQENIAINTRTQEEYDSLMRFFDSKDIGWNCGKASKRNIFYIEKENTCIRIFGKSDLQYCTKKWYKEEGYKIITPNQLQEYNEFICKNCKIINRHIVCKKCTIKNPKPEYITTHAELLKLHGRSVTCKIRDSYINDAKIFVDKNENISICQNERSGTKIADKLGFKYSWLVSSNISLYEKTNTINCKEIKLKEEPLKLDIRCGTVSLISETQYLTIGEAINWMLESEDNIIEYMDIFSNDDSAYKGRIVNRKLEYFEDNEWFKDKDNLNYLLENYTEIKKYIEEPKQKTLKEKLEAKEPFQYKDHRYRFNKNGAIICHKGSKALSLEFIKELLTKTEE